MGRKDFLLLVAGMVALLASADRVRAQATLPGRQVLVSVPDQKLQVLHAGRKVAEFPVSTSRFGEGDAFGSYQTPVGELVIAEKIGANLDPGAVLKHKRPTGEVLAPNAPGRDPIVTRILGLKGVEEATRNAGSRCIYIHGTPQERSIGRKASFGCIRMRSKDVIALFNQVGVGTHVVIQNLPLKTMLKASQTNVQDSRTLSANASRAPDAHAKSSGSDEST